MKKIPNNWVEVNLGEVLSLEYGKSLPSKKRSGEGFPVFGSNGVVGFHDQYLIEGPGIIVGRKGSHGEVVWSDQNFFPIDTTYYVSASKALNLRFSYYLLSYVDLKNLNRSTAIPGLNRNDAYALKILLPPLAEQQRIVVQLDLLFGHLERLKARLSRISELLQAFRQSVLSQAVTGKLTEEWRGTASVTLQSPIEIGIENNDAPGTWKWVNLVDVAKLESGHTPRKSIPEYWENGDVPWISLQDIRAVHGKVIEDTKYHPTILGIENSSARLLPKGTVCFSRDISVGYVTIMGKEMATTQHFANWICGNELLNSYLMYSFMASREYLIRSGQGTTVGTIYMPALKKMRILLPPVKEQEEIVKRIQSLFTISDSIESHFESVQTDIEKLPQAILEKAFTGHLVDQNSEDEPAEVLIQKIRQNQGK